MKYSDIINCRSSFVQGSLNLNTNNTPDVLDMPGNMYFQIYFHFNNGSCAEFYGDKNNNIQSGLLGLPTKESDIPLFKNNNSNEYITLKSFNKYEIKLYSEPNAWSYLVMNGEDERAKLLEQFIDLLYNISYETPWYFLKITGLDAAIERKLTMERDFKIDELRLKITINCLPDAVDNRIGTLLDLYRSIVYSWLLKKEIVPANLRKFDMSIYIFQAPMLEIAETGYEDEDFNELKKEAKFSYKYFEFHNCEIDYNSSKSGYSEINNTEGFNLEYAIDILFDDMYESRYNQWMKEDIGDLLYSDIISSLYELHPDYESLEQQSNQISFEAELDNINTTMTSLYEIYDISDENDGGIKKPWLSIMKEKMKLFLMKDNLKKLLLNAKKKALKELKRIALEGGRRLIQGLIDKLSMGNLFEPTLLLRISALVRNRGFNAEDVMGLINPNNKLKLEGVNSSFGRKGSHGSLNVNNHKFKLSAGLILDIIKAAGKDNYLSAVGKLNQNAANIMGNIYNKKSELDYEPDPNKQMDNLEEIEYEDFEQPTNLGNLYKMKSIENNI